VGTRSRLRIAFASHLDVDFTPEPARAIAIWTFEVARRLSRDFGYEVLAFRSTGDELDAETVADGVRFCNIGQPSSYALKPLSTVDYLSKSEPFGDYLFGTSLYFPRWAFRIASALRRHSCDIVHLHNFVQAVPWIRLLNPDITIVLHMHCGWLMGMPLAMVRSHLAKVDLALGCSEFVSAGIRSRFPQFASKTRVIYNGVDLDLFNPATHHHNGTPRAKRILFVGRISPEKGLHVLLEATKLLVAELPNVELDIVGPAAPQSALSLALLAEPDVDPFHSPIASYMGAEYLVLLMERMPRRLLRTVAFNVRDVPQAGILKHYARADLVVNPSLSESFGMSLIEAMASGVPVVATRVGGMTEVVADGETGLLVNPSDPGALAEAMRRVLTDDSLAHAFGVAGRERAEAGFSWDGIAARYAELLRERPAAARVDIRVPVPAGIRRNGKPAATPPAEEQPASAATGRRLA
jgi:glycosyltransferase involved in cell wall biosynthesis